MVTEFDIPRWLENLLDEIENSLTSDISLEKLSLKTGYSIRHLQRQFKAIAKENVGDYIRGRRLTMAMSEIMAGNKPILEIALDYGFESQEAFTRAFQARFVFPPRRFRIKKVDNPITLRTKIDADYLRFINSGALQLEPVLTTLKPMIFVGVGARVDQNSFQNPDWVQTISAAFTRLRDIPFQSEPSSGASFLVSYRESGLGDDKQHDIHMLAARQFDCEHLLPEGCECFVAPGGFYAVFNFKGEMHQLLQRSNYILGTWLPHSGYWLGNGPAIVELRMDYVSDLLTANSCIPLRRRSTRSYDPWWDAKNG